MKIIPYKKGYLIISLTSVVAIMTFSVVMRLFNSSAEEYYAIANTAKLTKARYLALSTLEIVHSLLKKYDHSLLLQYGFLPESPPIPLGMLTKSGDSVVKYSAYEQTGRINVNALVKFNENREDLRVRAMLNRLSDLLGIHSPIWDSVTDYIDSDDTAMPDGFERSDYERLDPPRKIKNARLHSLDELLLIPGFNHRILYDDLRSEDKKQEFSSDFATEEEKLIIDEENDYRLANNLTVYLPEEAALRTGDEDVAKINVNSATINTLMSLSDDITLDIAKAIMVAKLQTDSGRFKNTNEIQSLPEMKLPSATGALNVFESIRNYITVKDRIYKIVAEASVGSQTASVMSIYDVGRKKILMYLE